MKNFWVTTLSLVLASAIGANGQAALGALGTVVGLFLLAAAREPILALIASFISGAASIIALTTFFVSAQVSLPEWVRGRGLAKIRRGNAVNLTHINSSSPSMT